MSQAALPIISDNGDVAHGFTVTDGRGNYFVVDPAIFRENLAQARTLLGPDVRVMQVIKGGGYGIGVERAVAMGLVAGIDGFCAGTPQEALQVLELAPDADVLLFTACPPDQLPLLAQAGVVVTVNTIEAMQALILSNVAGRIYFELECGFGRFGLDRQALNAALDLYLGQSGLRLAGVYTLSGVSANGTDLRL